jgi:UDP-N-acetyl-D-mannosaminuronate dehydrogenase
MPEYFVSKLEEEIGNLQGKSVLILGVSYRARVKETAFSGAYDVRDSLLSRGAKPFFIDPLYTTAELVKLGFQSDFVPDNIDAIILHTAHQNFLDLDFTKFRNLKHVLDGRNFLNA